MSTYDELPYQSGCFPTCHPDAIALSAFASGLNPAPIHDSRVLEVGFGTGDQLTTLASMHPDAQFEGIDLSAVHVKSAENFKRELGVVNVEFRVADVCDENCLQGRFDYIIIHGVLSWVPRAAQINIFELCHRHLSDEGVALISYNCYPGWKSGEVLRDMLRMVDDLGLPVQDRVNNATRLAASLMTRGRSNCYTQSLRRSIRTMLQQQDSYIFHEYLADEHHPTYFSHFAADCEDAGLNFVSECGRIFPLNSLNTDRFHRISNEQMRDFYSGRTFRRSLVARHRPGLSYSREIRDFARLYLSAVAGRESDLSHEVRLLFEKKRPHETITLGDAASQMPGSNSKALDTILRYHQKGVLRVHFNPPWFGRSTDSTPTVFPHVRRAMAGNHAVFDCLLNGNKLRDAEVGIVEHEFAKLADGSRTINEISRLILNGVSAKKLAETVRIFSDSLLLT